MTDKFWDKKNSHKIEAARVLLTLNLSRNQIGALTFSQVLMLIELNQFVFHVIQMIFRVFSISNI